MYKIFKAYYINFILDETNFHFSSGVRNHQFIIRKNYGAEAFDEIILESGSRVTWDRDREREDDERWERGEQIYRRVYSRFDSQTLNSLPWKHTRPWYQQLVAATRRPRICISRIHSDARVSHRITPNNHSIRSARARPLVALLSSKRIQ